MKTILTSLTLALLLAPALQAGDHKKPALSSEERRIQDAQSVWTKRPIKSTPPNERWSCSHANRKTTPKA